MQFLIPEGATPIDDISDLKQKGVFTYEQLCEAEAENILKAARKYLQGRRSLGRDFFTERMLCKIHKEMFQDVWYWAGKFRKTTTNIGVKPYLIPQELFNLCQDVSFWKSDKSYIPLLEQAARIHHRLVFIHPFENGNGRHARLIADIYLELHNAIYPNWPVDLMRDGTERSVYIRALKEADRGNYEPLIQFMIDHGASVKNGL